MQALRVPILSAERTGQRDRDPEKLAQLAAAIAALLVLVWALADGFWPVEPLWTIAGLLALGLLAGPLAQLAGARPVHGYAQPAAAFAALLVVTFELPDAHPSWPVSPLWVVALLLGLGLAARPVMQLFGGRPEQESAQPIAALAAMLVLIWNLSVDGFWWYTSSPGLHSATGFRWERCGSSSSFCVSRSLRLRSTAARRCAGSFHRWRRSRRCSCSC